MARVPVLDRDATTSPAARRPERRDPERTREALIAAGTELFAERGFDGVSTDELARRAGVNKAMISYHFGGKLGLYRAIVAAMFAAIRQRMATLRGSGQEAPAALREFIAVFGEVAGQRYPAFPAMLLRELVTPGSPVVGEVVPYLAEVVGTVRSILERGARAGHFREVDPLATHLSMAGALVFFFATAPARARIVATMPPALKLKSPSNDEFVRHMQDLMTLGLARPRPGRKGR